MDTYRVETREMVNEALMCLDELDKLKKNDAPPEEIIEAAMLLLKEFAVVVTALEIPERVEVPPLHPRYVEVHKRVLKYNRAMERVDNIESDFMDSVFI